MSENGKTGSLHQKVQKGPEGCFALEIYKYLFLLPDGEENDIRRKPRFQNPNTQNQPKAQNDILQGEEEKKNMGF